MFPIDIFKVQTLPSPVIKISKNIYKIKEEDKSGAAVGWGGEIMVANMDDDN